MHTHSFITLLGALFLTPFVSADADTAGSIFPGLSRCKVMPQDKEWPSQATWDAFNASVDGRLIRTVPIASACHNPSFNGDECTKVQQQWHLPPFHEASSSSFMAPIFLNKSCDPFTAPSDQCIIGAYVQYAVDVAQPEHVIKTLAFAKQHNIRFIVRNTGHDYMGKSTGAGGLAVWMHHLTDRTWFTNFKAAGYSGPAVKAQAGILGDTLLKEAEDRGLVVVSGGDPSIGFAGGYVQGGGHSLVSSSYGMAADQVLAFEVITTSGKFIQVSATENASLFWALRGGGGGTYGIVWSVTVKAHPDFTVTSVHVLVQPTANTKPALDVYWQGIGAFLDESPKYLDKRVYQIALMDNTMFHVVLLFPKLTVKQTTDLTQPFFNKLQQLNITPSITEIVPHPTLRNSSSAINALFGGQALIATSLYGQRILPMRLWDTASSRSNLYSTFRGLADEGVHVVNLAIRPTLQVSGFPFNAVNPAFRTMHSMGVVLGDWNDTATTEEQFATARKVTTLTQRLTKLAPETGAYLNEADPFDPDWQKNFYGINYLPLLAIKTLWDPEDMLYGSTAVGGDRWVLADGGRLCRRSLF